MLFRFKSGKKVSRCKCTCGQCCKHNHHKRPQHYLDRNFIKEKGKSSRHYSDCNDYE